MSCACLLLISAFCTLFPSMSCAWVSCLSQHSVPSFPPTLLFLFLFHSAFCLLVYLSLSNSPTLYLIGLYPLSLNEILLYLCSSYFFFTPFSAYLSIYPSLSLLRSILTVCTLFPSMSCACLLPISVFCTLFPSMSCACILPISAFCTLFPSMSCACLHCLSQHSVPSIPQ